MLKKYIIFINESKDRYEEIYQNIYDIFIDFKDNYTSIDLQMLPNLSENANEFQKDAFNRFLTTVRKDLKETILFTFEVPENVICYTENLRPLINQINEYLKTEGYKKISIDIDNKVTMSRYDSPWFQYEKIN